MENNALHLVLTTSTTITALANALFNLSITGTTMAALARHKGPLRLVGGRTRIIVFIRYVRILIQLPCPRVTFYYVILEKRSYTREVRSCTLLSLMYSWRHSVVPYLVQVACCSPQSCDQLGQHIVAGTVELSLQPLSLVLCQVSLQT